MGWLKRLLGKEKRESGLPPGFPTNRQEMEAYEKMLRDDPSRALRDLERMPYRLVCARCGHWTGTAGSSGKDEIVQGTDLTFAQLQGRLNPCRKCGSTEMLWRKT